MKLTRRTALAAGLLLPAAAWGKGDPEISAPSGRYRGLREAGLQVFRGIRYGQSTVTRRFQAPLAPAPIRDAQEAGAVIAGTNQAILTVVGELLERVRAVSSALDSQMATVDWP